MQYQGRLVENGLDPGQRESSGEGSSHRVVPEGSQTRPRSLDVIIVTFNARAYLDDCLDSLTDNAASNVCMTVYLVDNASTDGTDSHVAHRYPQVCLQRRPTNDGFAAANNFVLKKSTARWNGTSISF